MNAAITGLPNPSWNIRELWAWLEVPNGDGGLYAVSVTPIFNNDTVSRWVKAAMKCSNTIIFWVVYCGQHANGTAFDQICMCGTRSYLPPDNILTPVAKDMRDNVREELDDDRVMWHPNSSSFPTK